MALSSPALLLLDRRVRDIDAICLDNLLPDLEQPLAEAPGDLEQQALVDTGRRLHAGAGGLGGVAEGVRLVGGLTGEKFLCASFAHSGQLDDYARQRCGVELQK